MDGFTIKIWKGTISTSPKWLCIYTSRELYRLWRLDPDDIEISMQHTDFPDSLTDLEREELEGGQNVEIGQRAVKFIVEHIIAKILHKKVDLIL